MDRTIETTARLLRLAEMRGDRAAEIMLQSRLFTLLVRAGTFDGPTATMKAMLA